LAEKKTKKNQKKKQKKQPKKQKQKKKKKKKNIKKKKKQKLECGFFCFFFVFFVCCFLFVIIYVKQSTFIIMLVNLNKSLPNSFARPQAAIVNIRFTGPPHVAVRQPQPPASFRRASRWSRFFFCFFFCFFACPLRPVGVCVTSHLREFLQRPTFGTTST